MEDIRLILVLVDLHQITARQVATGLRFREFRDIYAVAVNFNLLNELIGSLIRTFQAQLRQQVQAGVQLDVIRHLFHLSSRVTVHVESCCVVRTA